MMGRRRWWVLLLGLAACGGPAQQQTKKDEAAPDYSWRPYRDKRAKNLVPVQREGHDVVIENATILTAAGKTIEGGSIRIEKGKIAKISATKLEAGGAEVIDAKGKFVTPGIIDTHSHLGVYPTPGVEAHGDGNEATGPATPGVESIHGVWPQDPGFQTALAGGVTVLQVLPGSANLFGGGAVTLQMHPGISARAMMVPDSPYGLKMACGENPKRVYGDKGGPQTRMGNMFHFRKQFQSAKEALETYRRHEVAYQKWLKDKAKHDAAVAAAEEAAERDDHEAADHESGIPGDGPGEPPAPPPRDFAVEALMSVLEGNTLVHVHCYRADELVQVLELADEFGFKVRSFHHAVEAYKIRALLAEKDVAVSTWADWWGFKMEAHDAIVENAGLLSEAGARAIIHSDSGIGIQRLNQEAAKAYYRAKDRGVKVDDNDALRWITANPAWALGLEASTGTIEEGKRADLVIWSHHPFSVYASAEVVFVEGVKEWDLERSRRKEAQRWSDFEVYNLPEVTQ